MAARQKLNQAYFLGSVFLATLIGWAGQSWLVFFVTLAVLLASNVYSRQIRLPRRGNSSRSKQ